MPGLDDTEDPVGAPRVSAWLGRPIGTWILAWLSSPAAIVIGFAACACVTMASAIQGPLVPVHTEPATEAITNAVRTVEPETSAIRFGHYAQGPGIPDPSPPDEVPIEFQRDGATCTGHVDGLTGDQPRISDIECPDRLLTHDTRYLSPGWIKAGGVLAAATVAVTWIDHRRRARQPS